MADLELVRPSTDLLASYADVLRRGRYHSPLPASVQLEAIERDPDGFVGALATPGPLTARPGSDPEMHWMFFWLSDGEFSGEFAVRWRPGQPDLADPALGHVGYGIVEDKRRRGYATAGLGLLLARLRAEPIGLSYLDITTRDSNVGSKKVILANGATLVEQYESSPLHGGHRALRYRVSLVD